MLESDGARIEGRHWNRRKSGTGTQKAAAVSPARRQRDAVEAHEEVPSLLAVAVPQQCGWGQLRGCEGLRRQVAAEVAAEASWLRQQLHFSVLWSVQ